MHRALRSTSHRPWPVPARRWVGRQRWSNLLFAHWPVSIEQLRPLVPEPLKLQTFAGVCYVGVVPFLMSDVMVRGVPAVSGLSTFPELNVRVYVEHQGIPGVWFLSLDAASTLAVWGARRFFNLPYFRAHMSCHRQADDAIEYASVRKDGTAPFRSTYRPTSETFLATRGSLDEFLVERYCLYAQTRAGALTRMEVHHAPWPLQRATAEIDASPLLATHGLTPADVPPILHFAKEIDVITWLGVTV